MTDKVNDVERAREKLTALRKLCDASQQPFYVEIIDEVLEALTAAPTEEMVERVARALARADGKDPDAPAWVQGYGDRAVTFGICWRDQYERKARAAINAV